MFRPVFHLAVFSLNVFTIWYDQTHVDIPFPSKEIAQLPMKARCMFLTMWCLALQTLYFAVALLNDVFGTNEAKPTRLPFIRITKDTLFSLAFPVAVYVSIAFWTIYNIDRELIFPKTLDTVCPSWVNHTIHTAVTVFALIELVVTYRKYPPKILGYTLVSLFQVLYIGFLFMFYFSFDMWVYPFLAVLNWPVRIAFFMLTLSVGLGMYVMCEELNNLVWSMRVKLRVKQK